MISRLHVRNYKALRDVTLDLTRIHVLIGRNDSGKTSILEALTALSESVDKSLREAFWGTWRGRDLVWRGMDTTVAFGATFKSPIGECTYELGCRFGPTERDITIANETVELPSGAKIALNHSGHHSYLFRSSREPSLGNQENLEAAGLVRDALSGVHLYRWNPTMLAIPVATDTRRKFRMDVSGFGLAQCLDEILGHNRQRFEALEKRFTSIFQQFEEIRLVSAPAFKAPPEPHVPVPRFQDSDGKGIYFKRRDDEHVIPASQVSDGVLLVLAYLTLLYLPEPPSFVLIEEPENGIHPKRLDDVLRIVRNLVQEQRRTQVVLTTHSPYVVDLFAPEEVSLCSMNPTSGEVGVRRLSDNQLVEEQKDLFTLGEIWLGEGDEALSATGVASPIQDGS